MATGREPFRAEKPFAVIQKIIAEKPAKPRQVNSDISKTLEQIIERLLAKQPRDRFQSAEEVQQTLEKYLAHLQNPLASPKPKGIVSRSRSFAPMLGVCAAALLAASGWFAYMTGAFSSLPAGTNNQRQSAEEQSDDSMAAVLDPFESNVNILGTSEIFSDDVFEMQLNMLSHEIAQIETEFIETDSALPMEPANPLKQIIIDKATVNELERSPAIPKQENNQPQPRGHND